MLQNNVHVVCNFTIYGFTHVYGIRILHNIGIKHLRYVATHTHTRIHASQRRLASVGLAQARPNKAYYWHTGRINIGTGTIIKRTTGILSK